MTQNQQSNSLKLALQFYYARVRKYPGAALGVILSMPFTVLFSRFLPPLILAKILDKLIAKDYDPNNLIASFGWYVGLYFGVLLTGIALWRLIDYFMWRLEQRIQLDIANIVFRHLISRSVDFHANTFGGSLVSQTNKLLGGYVRLQDSTIYQAYPLFVGILIASIIIFPRSPLYVAGLLAFCSVYLLVALLLSKKIFQHLASFAEAESRQTGMLADAVTNISVIKSYARKNFEEDRFYAATKSTQGYLRRFARSHQKQMNVQGFMNRFISSFALIAAIVAVVVYDSNIATVFLIFTFTATIVEGLFDFGNNTLRSYNRALSDAAEMATTLAQSPEITDPENPEASRMHHGAVEFRDVTFTHNGADDALFDSFNLSIKPGEKVGLVGHSGSGKTTFTRLMLRFSDIHSGEICIDGQNIATVTQDDLHESIAYVPQEPLLFHRSIAENIRYGRLDANADDIAKAAKDAHATEFIDKLPSGYDTLVGERGVKLSGGQRQRIAIARAMIKNAPILVLDEATSALDSESEVLIQAALWKLMEGRTAIVIAHRLSTIQKMDRIIVLDDGKIVEQGSHKELIRKDGVYAKLWAHQSGGFIEE
ncbi:MAG: ABC transporter ATP-binding protein [Candidatus Saccharimonadales bacterium]